MAGQFNSRRKASIPRAILAFRHCHGAISRLAVVQLVNTIFVGAENPAAAGRKVDTSRERKGGYLASLKNIFSCSVVLHGLRARESDGIFSRESSRRFPSIAAPGLFMFSQRRALSVGRVRALIYFGNEGVTTSRAEGR